MRSSSEPPFLDLHGGCVLSISALSSDDFLFLSTSDPELTDCGVLDPGINDNGTGGGGGGTKFGGRDCKPRVALFRSSAIICWGRGMVAQLYEFNMLLCAAFVMTSRSLVSISGLSMPGIWYSAAKHLLTYSRTAGDQSVFFRDSFDGVGDVAVASGGAADVEW